MTQALPKIFTFEEFAAKYPDKSGKHYELHDGTVIEMPQPTGDHEQVVGFLAFELTRECIGLNLPYFIPKTVLVKPPKRESAYSPDVLLLNRPNLANEPLWKQKSTVTQATSIPLVIEVVSTNWRDDYHKKYADYEEMGIPEYWVVDYAALGGREFIGKPKQPTILVCCLDEGEYQINKFRGDDRIHSLIFPDLNLTAQQIFEAGGVM